MTRSTLFNSPLLLGFDQLEDALNQVSKHGTDGYPPYNVEELSADRLRITLAVAGFSRSDLSIQLERNQLVIEGRQQNAEDAVYLHRGIAARRFKRSFMLADGIEVTEASLEHGLLHIDLQRPEQHAAVRTIEIGTPGKQGSAASKTEIEEAGD